MEDHSLWSSGEMDFRAHFSAVLLCLCGLGPVWAGPKVYVGAKESQRLSMDQIDHSAWNQLLNRYVRQDGMVRYSKWKSSTEDRNALDKYLVALSQADPARNASENAKIAFWINAYNALTVKGILREYPTTSIRNHTARLLGYNIWKDLMLYVGGQAVSLEHIEHQVLRKMNEPRIHFAIVCASIGCPRLLNQAYTGEQVQQQLEDNAIDFFSRSQNFRYDSENKRFDLSAILSWFAADFGASKQAQLRTIARWLPPSARSAALSNSVRVTYLNYNWKLNEWK